MEQRRDDHRPSSETRPSASSWPAELDALHLERAVAGSVMLGAEAAGEVLQLLGPTDLLDERLGQVLAAAAALLADGVAPDPLTVRAQLHAAGHTPDAMLLADLVHECPSRGSARFLATAVLRVTWRRRVLQAGQRLAQAATHDSDETVADLVVSETQAIDSARRRWTAAGAGR